MTKEPVVTQEELEEKHNVKIVYMHRYTHK